MRHIVIRAIAGLFLCAGWLSACAGPNHRQPDGPPIIITRQVEAHLQTYFRTLGGGGTGAFAVSESGTVGFFAYCSTGHCRGQFGYTNEALQHCEGFGQGHCVILAINHEIVRPYRTMGQEQAALPE